MAIVTLREQLSADGLDAGPLTLQCGTWPSVDSAVPSTSTIRRILRADHPARPRKRKSSYRRLPPTSPTSVGSPTSPASWPTAPTPRSCPGSTTIPATCTCTAYRRVCVGDVVATDTPHAAYDMAAPPLPQATCGLRPSTPPHQVHFAVHNQRLIALNRADTAAWAAGGPGPRQPSPARRSKELAARRHRNHLPAHQARHRRRTRGLPRRSRCRL